MKYLLLLPFWEYLQDILGKKISVDVYASDFLFMTPCSNF